MGVPAKLQSTTELGTGADTETTSSAAKRAGSEDATSRALGVQTVVAATVEMVADHFSSSVDSKSGSIARWVAGQTSNARFVFLSHLADSALAPGEAADWSLYLLSRAHTELAAVDCQVEASRRPRGEGVIRFDLGTATPTPLDSLLADEAVRTAISMRFGDSSLGERFGLGSLFVGAHYVGGARLAAAHRQGRGEVMVNVFFNGTLDLTLHNVLRMNGHIGESRADHLGAPPMNELVGGLEIDDDPTRERVAEFASHVEVLIALATRLVDEGAFDHDPEMLRIVERDRSYLRSEVFETDAPFALGDALGAIVARLEGFVLSVSSVGEPAQSLLRHVIDATAHDSPFDVTDVLDELIDVARLDDPDWLAEQDRFDAYVGMIDEIGEIGARRWLAKVAGWWDTPAARDLRSDAATGGTTGGVAGGAIGLIIAATTTAAAGTAVGVGVAVGGAVGAILAASLTYFFGRYRARRND